MERAKEITVLDLVSRFGQSGDDIPVVVRRGTDELGRARCGYSASAVLDRDVLRKVISYIAVYKDRIVIQVK